MPDSYLGAAVVLSTADAVAQIPVEGYGGVAFQIQGTFSGTITFEATVHGSEFQPFRVTASNNSTPVTTATTAGIYIGSTVGFTAVRARMSSYSSGGASVMVRATPASPGGAGGGGGTGSDVNLIEVGGAAIALGETTMAASLPVVVASDQTPIPITGSISATNPSVGTTGDLVPTEATLVGFQDASGDLAAVVLEADGSLPVTIAGGSAGNPAAGPTGSAVPADASYTGFLNPSGDLEGLALESLDYDSGAGTQPQSIIGIALPADGGPVAGGTATNPVRVDPTGTTTQPISAASLPLPTGAATAANQQTDALTDAELRASPVPVDGSGSTQPVSGDWLTDTELRATPVPVSLTSTTITGTVAATQSGTWNITNISGTVSLPTGAATAALQTQPGVDIGDVTVNNGAAGAAVNIQDGGNSITVDQGTATNLKTQAECYQGGSAVASGNPLQVTLANTGANSTAVKVDGSAATQPVSLAAASTGGASTMNATSGDGSTALTNSAQVIKASAGTLYSLSVYNPNTAVAYVILYNTAAASVTVGTTNPLFIVPVPPLTLVAPVFGGARGVNFSNAGWSWAATSTAGGNGAPTTALDAVAFYG